MKVLNSAYRMGWATGSTLMKLPMVPGMEQKVLAKMMGMTPLMFSFRGR